MSEFFDKLGGGLDSFADWAEDFTGSVSESVENVNEVIAGVTGGGAVSNGSTAYPVDAANSTQTSSGSSLLDKLAATIGNAAGVSATNENKPYILAATVTAVLVGGAAVFYLIKKA